MANVNRDALANGYVRFNEITPSKHVFIAQPKPNRQQLEKHTPSTGITNGEAHGHAYTSYPSLDSPVSSDLPRSKPKDVYDAILPSWRAAIRTKLVQVVNWESMVLAEMQVR